MYWKQIGSLCLMCILLSGGPLSCARKHDPARLDQLSTDCAGWCASSYKKELAKGVCSEGCNSYVASLRSSLIQGESCRKARQFSLDTLRKQCVERDQGAEACKLGGEYAHSISLDYCIDRTE